MAPDELASVPHSAVVRGGAVGCAAAASSEPPGLQRRAIFQWVGRNPEQHRQRFRLLELGESGRPFVMAQQLRDACRRWLLAGEGGVDQIIDHMVLEQFIARLPRKTAQWATARRRWIWPSNSQRTRWWRATGLAKPCLLSLSLSPLLHPHPLPFFLGPVPAWYLGPSPDGGEVRHRSGRRGSLG